MTPLLAAAFLLAYANGANDNFKGVASLYGGGVLSRKASLRLANGATLAGCLAALWLAGTLAAKFSGKGLVPDSLSGAPSFALAVGLGAGATVLLATRLGLPISTTHALLGALLGAGLAWAPAKIAFGVLGSIFLMPLLLSPLLSFCASAMAYPALSGLRRALGVERGSCACVSLARTEPAGMQALLFFRGEEKGCQAAYQGRLLGLSARTMVDSLHLASAAMLSFSRGLNDAPKIAALFLLAGLPQGSSMAAVALAMLAGGLAGTRRVAEKVSHGVTEMEVGAATSANLVSSTLVLLASALGSPVSTTHVTVGALAGLGAATGKAHWKGIAGIAAAWLGTLPLGAALAFAVALAMGA